MKEFSSLKYTKFFNACLVKMQKKTSLILSTMIECSTNLIIDYLIKCSTNGAKFNFNR